MVPEAEPRVHSAALLAGVAVVLGATVWWWVAAAPEAPPQAAAGFSAAETSVADPADPVVAEPPPVDSGTADLAATDPRALEIVERLLPESQNVIRREATTLAGGAEIRFDVTTAQDVYRIQVVCIGPGDVEVTVAGDGGRDSRLLPCTEEVQDHVFSPFVESFWVLVRRPAADPAPVSVATQLVTQ